MPSTGVRTSTTCEGSIRQSKPLASAARRQARGTCQRSAAHCNVLHSPLPENASMLRQIAGPASGCHARTSRLRVSAGHCASAAQQRPAPARQRRARRASAAAAAPPAAAHAPRTVRRRARRWPRRCPGRPGARRGRTAGGRCARDSWYSVRITCRPPRSRHARPERDVGAAPGHVGGHRDRAAAAPALRDDLPPRRGPAWR